MCTFLYQDELEDDSLKYSAQRKVSPLQYCNAKYKEHAGGIISVYIVVESRSSVFDLDPDQLYIASGMREILRHSLCLKGNVIELTKKIAESYKFLQIT